MSKERKTKSRIILSFVLVGIGLIIIIAYLVKIYKNGYLNTGSINLEYSAQAGDFIGGIIGAIFTLVGIVLLFETLSLQRIEFEESRKVFQTQQFENKFFSLLNLYQEIIRTFHYEMPNTSEKFIGKEYFEMHKNDIYYAFNSTVSFFNNRKHAKSLYTSFYLKNKESLGQYFRTLYRLFKLIEESNFELVDKISYVKIIRGQLSESELFFINYNASTQFGEKFQNIITKYNLIKHLPILERVEFKEWKNKLTPEKTNAVSLVFEEINDFMKSGKLEYYKSYLKGRFAIKINRTNKNIELIIFRNNNTPFSNFIQEGWGLDDFSNQELEKILKSWFIEFFYFRKYIETDNKNLKFKVDVIANGNQKTKITCTINNIDNSDLKI
jgi:hypothetical protein